MEEIGGASVSTDAIRTTVREGRLELRVPSEWPEGAEVEIRRVDQNGSDEEQAMRADEIAATLAAMDRVQPFDLSDDEQAAIEADRRARKEWEIAHFQERAERIVESWE
jgi:hypothetical protein